MIDGEPLGVAVGGVQWVEIGAKMSWLVAFPHRDLIVHAKD